jgi:hypothetical protein
MAFNERYFCKDKSNVVNVSAVKTSTEPDRRIR